MDPIQRHSPLFSNEVAVFDAYWREFFLAVDVLRRAENLAEQRQALDLMRELARRQSFHVSMVEFDMLWLSNTAQDVHGNPIPLADYEHWLSSFKDNELDHMKTRARYGQRWVFIQAEALGLNDDGGYGGGKRREETIPPARGRGGG
jgi:hypothetical protein